MCGICGVLNFNGEPVHSSQLTAMRDVMGHRGPDDAGIFTGENLGLAHRRLSIIDLSPAGHQPMVNADNSLVIVYNGEIYNFLSLKEQLISKGHEFHSRTDTEVLLHGFMEYGEEIVNKINGMFAFGIWDKRRKELFLVRDRLGIKPLYYYQDAHRFIFASEIKSILKAGVRPKLEESAVSSYFSLRYVPGELTMFKGIKKVPAGCVLKINHRGEVKRSVYWDLLNQNKIDSLTEKEAQGKFYEILDDSVSSRLMADVPVGAFLSGGIDSSAITALMKSHQKEVETFTFGFNADIDETGRAEYVSKYLNVKNTSIVLNDDDFKYFSKALWHLEEPLGDSIISPTFLLAESASKKVKVVLLGEGADEILGGYVHQLAMTYGNIYKSLVPGYIRSLFLKLFQKTPQKMWEMIFPYPSKMGRSGSEKILGYLKTLDFPVDSYFQLAGVFSEEQKQDLFVDEFFEAHVRPHSPKKLFQKYWEQTRSPVFQNQLLQMDLKFWNADYTLLRMDKLTMAHSLEARVPFLDYRLVELCLSLPRKFKTRRFQEKTLFRKSLREKNILPGPILNAKKKAFFLPVEKCFGKKFEQFTRDILDNGVLKKRGIMNCGFVEKLLENPSRELLGNKQLMVVLNFEIWCRLFLDQAGVSADIV